MACDPADEHLKTFYVDAKDVAIAPASPERLYIATSGSEPIAVLEAYSAHGIIGFYAIASTAAVRGKGYTAALIINALREAKKAGLRLASLQCPEALRTLYERLGFISTNEMRFSGDLDAVSAQDSALFRAQG